MDTRRMALLHSALLLIAVTFFVGCGNPVNLEALIEKDGVYYGSDSKSPYAGPVFSLHENGNIWKEGNLKSGVPDGTWTYWSEDGDFLFEENWQDGLENPSPVAFDSLYWSEHDSLFYKTNDSDPYSGIVYHMSRSGKKRFMGIMHDGSRAGLWYAYGEDGQKIAQGHYNNGIRDGVWITWYEEYALGLTSLLTELFSTEIPSTIHRGFENSAFHYPIQTKNSWKLGVLIGPYTRWWPNGQMEERGFYSQSPDGIVHHDSLWTTWYENGTMRRQYFYRDGVSSGRDTRWDSNGKKLHEGFYVDGKKEGPWTEWWIGGRKEGFYKRDLKDSLWTSYSVSGIKESQTFFRKGVPHGPFFHWYESGQLSYEGTNSRSQSIGRWIAWWENGLKESEGFLIISDNTRMRDSVWTTWDESGNILTKKTYKKGKLIDQLMN